MWRGVSPSRCFFFTIRFSYHTILYHSIAHTVLYHTHEIHNIPEWNRLLGTCCQLSIYQPRGRTAFWEQIPNMFVTKKILLSGCNHFALYTLYCTWIFQVCKIYGKVLQKPTKRQKIYISGRSRYTGIRYKGIPTRTVRTCFLGHNWPVRKAALDEGPLESSQVVCSWGPLSRVVSLPNCLIKMAYKWGDLTNHFRLSWDDPPSRCHRCPFFGLLHPETMRQRSGKKCPWNLKLPRITTSCLQRKFTYVGRSKLGLMAGADWFEFWKRYQNRMKYEVT